MKIAVILIILFSCLNTNANEKKVTRKTQNRRPSTLNCPIENLKVHFYAQIGYRPNSILVINNYDLNNDRINDLFLADQDSCGSKGCEYSIYFKFSDTCYKYAGFFDGHVIEIENDSQIIYKTIKVLSRSDAIGSNKISYYEFDPANGFYKKKQPK